MRSLEGLGVADFGCGVIAAGALLRYLTDTQKTSLAHMTKLQPYVFGNFMILTVPAGEIWNWWRP